MTTFIINIFVAFLAFVATLIGIVGETRASKKINRVKVHKITNYGWVAILIGVFAFLVSFVQGVHKYRADKDSEVFVNYELASSVDEMNSCLEKALIDREDMSLDTVAQYLEQDFERIGDRIGQQAEAYREVVSEKTYRSASEIRRLTTERSHLISDPNNSSQFLLDIDRQVRILIEELQVPDSAKPYPMYRLDTLGFSNETSLHMFNRVEY